MRLPPVVPPCPLPYNRWSFPRTFCDLRSALEHFFRVQHILAEIIHEFHIPE